MKYPLPIVLFFHLLFSASLYAADSSRYFLVFLNPNPNLEGIGDSLYTFIQMQHLQDMTRLQQSGFLVSAGPFEGGGGVFIVRAFSEQNVSDSMETDAVVIHKRSSVEIYPMTIYRGGLCEGNGEDMRSYAALRLNNIRFGEKDRSAEQTKHEIDDWIANAEKQGSVLFVCLLGGEIPESVLIVVDAVEKKRLGLKRYTPKAPGSFVPILKNFFIAHGTFCETE